MAAEPLWTSYLSKDTGSLLARLSEVCQELSGLHQEVAMVRGAEKQAKVRGFMEAQAPSVTAREKVGDYNALDITTTVFSLQGQIQSLQEEQRLLEMLIALPATVRPDAVTA